MSERSVEWQRDYYARTAGQYDALHVAASGRDEHFLALCILDSLLPYYGCRSVLDVGAGTGRAVTHLQTHHPGLRVLGIEPVPELRAQGHAKGIDSSSLIAGDATNLEFEGGHFDAVCAFGVLHHVARPEKAVAEMLRVAKRLIFISDSNNFGQGGTWARCVKQALNAVGLWKVADLVKTRGKGYTISEGDGLAYSYSVFTNLPQIRAECSIVHLFNTENTTSANLYRGAGHVAVVGVKSA